MFQFVRVHSHQLTKDHAHVYSAIINYDPVIPYNTLTQLPYFDLVICAVIGRYSTLNNPNSIFGIHVYNLFLLLLNVYMLIYILFLNHHYCILFVFSVKSHNAIIRHLKLLQNHEDFELKKLLITILVVLSRDRSVIPVSETIVLYCNGGWVVLVISLNIFYCKEKGRGGIKHDITLSIVWLCSFIVHYKLRAAVSDQVRIPMSVSVVYLTVLVLLWYIAVGLKH